MIDLSARRVLVTGASKGIGAACARMFARAGAAVAVHYRSDRAGAERVVADAIAAGARAVPLQAELSTWDEGERLVDAAHGALGGLDVAVMNHGIWKGAGIDEMTEAQYDEMMDINLRASMAIAGAAARRMKPQRSGRLIFIASTAGQRGEAMHSHYAASKGAIISLTKSLAPELAPWGILVNCVAPGWVDTPMSAGTMGDEKLRNEVFATIPLRRVGTPEEIAGPVVFLASELANFVTGEIFNVNGGAVLVG
jgi:3-oxoacyl-[acyl-carrier protein] reductase